MLPLALLAWESEVNLRGALEQRYLTNLVSHHFVTGAAGALAATAASPLAVYKWSLSGGYFGAYPLAMSPAGAISSHQFAGQIGGDAMWQTSPRTRLASSTRGRIASELASSVENDSNDLDVFAGNRVQYTVGHDLRFSAEVSPRTSLSIGGGYGQTGTLAASGAIPLGIDAHSVRSQWLSSFEATSVDELSAELGLRYSGYEQAIIDPELGRGGAETYAGTVMLKEAHEFSQNLRGRAGAGVTGAIAHAGHAGESGFFPEAVLEMSYTGSRYDISWGYALAYTSLGPRIGDGQSHAGWLKTSVSPARGRVFRDLTVRGMGSVSHGTMQVGEQADAGQARVWSAAASVDVDCPIVPRLALTSGLRMDLRRIAVETAASPEGATTSVRLGAMVGIRGVLWAHPADREGRKE